MLAAVEGLVADIADAAAGAAGDVGAAIQEATVRTRGSVGGVANALRSGGSHAGLLTSRLGNLEKYGDRLGDAAEALAEFGEGALDAADEVDDVVPEMVEPMADSVARWGRAMRRVFGMGFDDVPALQLPGEEWGEEWDEENERRLAAEHRRIYGPPKAELRAKRWETDRELTLEFFEAVGRDLGERWGAFDEWALDAWDVSLEFFEQFQREYELDREYRSQHGFISLGPRLDELYAYLRAYAKVWREFELDRERRRQQGIVSVEPGSGKVSVQIDPEVLVDTVAEEQADLAVEAGDR